MQGIKPCQVTTFCVNYTGSFVSSYCEAPEEGMNPVLNEIFGYGMSQMPTV